MLSIGEVVKLSDNKEYVVLNKIQLNSFNYLYLITTSKPIEFLVATEKEIDGKIVLNEVKDNEELDYALNQLQLEKE